MNRASLLLLLWRFLGLVDLGDTLVVNYPLRVQKHFYTSLFYVGTPPKRFELAFDITSTVLWIYADNVEQSSTTLGPNGSDEDAGVQIYKASESQTSELVGDFTSSNMLLETIDLDLYKDLIVHEDQTLGNLLFGTIEYDPQLNLYVPFDGIFGIDRFLLDNMTTWPQAEMQHSGSKVFTLYTPHVHQEATNQTMEISPIDAMLTVGDPPAFPNCAKRWTRLPMSGSNNSHGFFDFKLNRAQFGGQHVAYSTNAVFSFSTLTSFITVDSQYYRLLVQKIKARNETTRFGRPHMIVDCAQLTKAPPIEFYGPEDVKFVVPPTSYIQRCGYSGRCILRVRENQAEFRNRWVLGSPFFHEYCLQFRYDNNTVGIAQAVHDTVGNSTTLPEQTTLTSTTGLQGITTVPRPFVPTSTTKSGLQGITTVPGPIVPTSTTKNGSLENSPDVEQRAALLTMQRYAQISAQAPEQQDDQDVPSEPLRFVFPKT